MWSCEQLLGQRHCSENTQCFWVLPSCPALPLLRNVLELIFPLPSQPAALNELKFTWLIKKICYPPIVPWFQRWFYLRVCTCLTSLTCFSWFLFLWCSVEAQSTAALGCVSHGGAGLLCPSDLFHLLLLPAAAGLWELCWKMRQGIAEEWENLIFEESGILGICGLPTQPFFLQAGCTSFLLPQSFSSLYLMLPFPISSGNSLCSVFLMWNGNGDLETSNNCHTNSPDSDFITIRAEKWAVLGEKIPWLSGVISTDRPVWTVQASISRKSKHMDFP